MAEAGVDGPTLTELGQGVGVPLVKNCPKCGRLNWQWTDCDHGPRKLDRPPAHKFGDDRRCIYCGTTGGESAHCPGEKPLKRGPNG